MDSLFSVFVKNVQPTKIDKQHGGTSKPENKGYNRDLLLKKFLEYYDNKKYSTPEKKREAIMKDMMSLKNEKYRIYLDNNGDVEITFDNLFKLKNYIGGNVKDYDIIARNPEYYKLGIDGFTEGQVVDMGEILGREEYNGYNITSVGEAKTKSGELYSNVASDQYKKRAGNGGFRCKDGRVVSKLHYCKMKNREDIDKLNIKIKSGQSSRVSSPASSRTSSRANTPANSPRSSQGSRMGSRVSSPMSRVSSPMSKVSSPTIKVSSPMSRVSSPKSRVSTPKSRVSSPTIKLSSPRSSQGSKMSSRVSSPKSRVSSPKSIVSSPKSRVSSDIPLIVNVSENESSRSSTPNFGYNSGFSSPLTSNASSILSGGKGDDNIQTGGNNIDLIQSILNDDNTISIDNNGIYGNTRENIFDNISSVSEFNI